MIKIFLALVLLVVIGGGGVYVLSQQSPSVASGLKKVPVSSQASKSFDDKVKVLEKALADAKASGKAAPVQVSFTEEELTSKAAEASSSLTGGLAAKDTQIHLSGSDVIATSTVTVQGLSVPLGVVATPVVENGQTKIVVQQIQTGGLPLPDALRQQIEAQIGKAVDPTALGLPFDVSKLQVVNGQLVISGTAKP